MIKKKKSKKFNLCISFLKQAINIWKPTEENEKFLFNKLKAIVDNEPI